jgi:O-antigen ligase
MSRILAPEPSISESRPTGARSHVDALVRLAGATTIWEAALVVGFLALLPVERIFTFDALGFTVRPAFFFMGAFLVTHVRALRPGIAAMPTALLALVAVAVSVPGSFDPKASLGYAAWATFTVAFSLALAGYLRGDEARVRGLLELYCATAGVWGIFTIAQWFASFANADLAYSWLGSVPRLHGLAYESSFLAFYLVPPLILSVAARRHVWGIPILLALILSTSRSALIGIVIGAAVVFALSDRPRRILVAKGGIVVAVAIAMLAVPIKLDYLPIADVPGAVPRDVAKRGSRGKDFYKDFIRVRDQASTVPRIQSWKDGWTTYRQAPVTGVGVDAYGPGLQHAGRYTTLPSDSVKTTNLYVESLAEMGPLGLLALFLWTFAPIPYLWRLRRRSSLAVPLLAALLASAVMFTFVQTWWVPYRWLPWVLAYALVASQLQATLARWTHRAPAALSSGERTR